MLEKLKKIIKSNFKYFSFFYEYLNYRLFLIVLVSVFVGLLDALSISIFIPLFSSSNQASSIKVTDDVFNLEYFLDFFNISKSINSLLLVMLFFFILKGIFRYIDVYYRTYMTSFFIKSIRSGLLQLVSQIKYSKFVKTEMGLIQNTLSKECDNVIYGYNLYISVFQNFIFVLVYLVLSFWVNTKFTVIVLVGGWVSNFIFKKFYIDSSKISYSISNKNNVFMSLILQKVTNFKYLKATARIDKYKKKVEDVMIDIENEQMKLGLISGLVLSLREPLLILFLVIAIYFQINILGGQIASILFTLLLFYRTFSSLMAVQTSWTGFLKYVGSIKHVKKFRNELVDEKETFKGAIFTGFSSAIRVQEVSFQYNQKQTIIEKVNLEIPKNKSVAFVGKSGSGKTTLLNLIIGLLDPVAGKICIDDNPLSQYNLETYRKKIGFISQESVVFNDTFFNNVTFWDEKTPENVAKFKDIVSKVDLLDFLEDAVEKEDLILGDNGVLMSGGQRQRLSIARELYRDTEILVLDEATSSLDTQTEKFIQKSIDSLRGKVTIIIIAHRLSTIKNVDIVFLLDNGRVEKSGNFEELIESSPTFKDMVKLQEI